MTLMFDSRFKREDSLLLANCAICFWAWRMLFLLARAAESKKG